MTFPTGEVIAVTGTVAAGGAAAVTAFLNRSSAELESGQLVRQNIPPEMDIYAEYLVSRGAPQRGWRWRIARHGDRAGQRIIHPGKDITAPPDLMSPAQAAHTITIHAARSGVVEHSGMANGYGEGILLRHRDGSTTWYAHLNDRLVRRGQIVRGGDVIAHMGRTSVPGLKPTDPSVQGRSCEGTGPRCDPRCSGPRAFKVMNPHLHFSVHGVPVPPGAESGPLVRQGRKLPALPPRRTAVRAWGGVDFVRMSTDRGQVNEYQYGVDPEAWLAQHGIRLAGSA